MDGVLDKAKIEVVHSYTIYKHVANGLTDWPGRTKPRRVKTRRARVKTCGWT